MEPGNWAEVIDIDRGFSLDQSGFMRAFVT